MIRVTVKELYELQRVLQASGQVNATIGPDIAFTTDKLFVAWAKSRTDGREPLYLAVWKDADAWRKLHPLVGHTLADHAGEDEEEEEEEYTGLVLAEEEYYPVEENL